MNHNTISDDKCQMGIVMNNDAFFAFCRRPNVSRLSYAEWKLAHWWLYYTEQKHTVCIHSKYFRWSLLSSISFNILMMNSSHNWAKIPPLFQSVSTITVKTIKLNMHQNTCSLEQFKYWAQHLHHLWGLWIQQSYPSLISLFMSSSFRAVASRTSGMWVWGPSTDIIVRWRMC